MLSRKNHHSSSRRRFLKFGIFGGAVLFLGTIGSRWIRYGTDRAPLPSFQVLRAQDRTILAALIPAILKGTIPGGDPAAVEHSLKLTDTFLATQSLYTRGEFYKLCGALSLFHSWDSFSPEQAESFLNGYRTSWIRLRTHIYCSLVQMVTIPWYGETEAWKAIGYPGPPSL